MEPARSGRRRSIREGKAHIQSFEEKYQVLDRQNPSLKLAKPELQDEGMTAVFPYLEGKTRAELLGEILTAQGRGCGGFRDPGCDG